MRHLPHVRHLPRRPPRPPHLELAAALPLRGLDAFALDGAGDALNRDRCRLLLAHPLVHLHRLLPLRARFDAARRTLCACSRASSPLRWRRCVGLGRRLPRREPPPLRFDELCRLGIARAAAAGAERLERSAGGGVADARGGGRRRGARRSAITMGSHVPPARSRW